MKRVVDIEAPIVSGNANNEANAGFGNVNSNNEASNTNTNIGSQLYWKIITLSKPYLLVKNKTNQNGVGSESKDSAKFQQMKRYGNLFQTVCSIENLTLADKRARKGKKCKTEIQAFDSNRDELLLKLQIMLLNQTFKTSKYHVFKKVVDNGKEREIYRLPYYPDRILHHAVMNVIEPIFFKTFTTDTYSCIKGRGIHSAAEKVKYAIRQPDAEYVLKLDVKKFYPSVDHDVLKFIIRRKIKDNDLLWMLDEIIDSAKGLPIGNYLSQSFANLFLSGFDHWIKEVQGIRHYFRYCDDMVIFHQDKTFLHALLIEITNYLADLKLTVKKDWRVFPAYTGVDFVGFVFYPTHTLIRKSIKKRFVKAIIKYKAVPSPDHYRSLASYWGWLKYSNSINLIKKLRA